ncbi:MAG: nucleotidyltransferase family protein [Planctomycetes bacterium]|nr:nucleotidyltransferase family protein [Planctomycetota bacterium]MBL7145340.1 nucleotidyltransferase family protein [Phycisphaerae bacterium]
MFTQEDILGQLNKKAEELKQNFSVRSIGLFGSLVRNEADNKSDVDILVDFVKPTFDHYMDLKFYLERLFDRPVDLVIADTVKPRLKPIIDKEVIYAKGL